jgi:hypothetical protein
MARSFALARLRPLTLAAVAAVPAIGGCAVPPPPLDRQDGRWVQVEIVDRDSERPLRVWRGQGDAFVVGTPGTRYAVRLTNRSGERLLAVVSVDGVNILSGETAGVQQRGYVLSPRDRTSLTGWRKSDAQVAAFEFTALADSYAARTGRPGEVGVIGVAVFRERPPAVVQATEAPAVRDEPPAPPPASPVAPADGAPAADRARSAQPAGAAAPEARVAPGERIGTGHGARETSYATTVRFERATREPVEILHVRYDSLDNLVAAGIVPRSMASAGRSDPRPFPLDEGFVPDPPLH